MLPSLCPLIAQAVSRVITPSGVIQAGLVVLPCGAGKTLTAIAIACRVGLSVAIVCPHKASVEQWRAQLLRCTDISQSRIVRLTSKHKETLPGTVTERGHYHNLIGGNGAVLLTTYAMTGVSNSLDWDTPLGEACRRQWGLLILDEVHMAPADKFKRCVERLHAKCVLGLTATLLREDSGIDAIPRLIGPVLYEAHAKDLEASGYLTPAQCCEVQCEPPEAFAAAYQQEVTRRRLKSGPPLLLPPPPPPPPPLLTFPSLLCGLLLHLQPAPTSNPLPPPTHSGRE